MISAWKNATVMAARRISDYNTVLELAWLRRGEGIAAFIAVGDRVEGAVYRLNVSELATCDLVHFLIAVIADGHGYLLSYLSG
jgi:hypothetical protein